MTPEKFFESLKLPEATVNGVPIARLSVVFEAMRLYGEHVAKEVRHKAAEISLMDDPEYRHRMIMNIKI